MKLLLAEDERELLSGMAEGLRLSGFAVDTAEDGETAASLCFETDYDLMVLDINLPKLDGFSVLSQVRAANPRMNIIILTARASLEDRLRGFDLGANDYLLKPFYFEELEARIRSLLRRQTIQKDRVLRAGALSFDTVSREASLGGRRLHLTGKESGILEYLLLNRGRYVSQEELLEHVWDSEIDAFSNTVRVHMAALRKKLGCGAEGLRITNAIGKGYLLDEKNQKSR